MKYEHKSFGCVASHLQKIPRNPKFHQIFCRWHISVSFSSLMKKRFCKFPFIGRLLKTNKQKKPNSNKNPWTTLEQTYSLPVNIQLKSTKMEMFDQRNSKCVWSRPKVAFHGLGIIHGLVDWAAWIFLFQLWIYAL